MKRIPFISQLPAEGAQCSFLTALYKLISGHTVTYLPPWHEKILNLESYDPVLKTADLWAIACVIFFLLPSDQRDLHGHVRGVWSKPMGDIQQNCVTCSVRNSHARKCCDDCKKKFLHFVSPVCSVFVCCLHWLSLLLLFCLLWFFAYIFVLLLFFSCFVA